MSLIKGILCVLYLSILIYIVFFARRRREIASHANIVHVVPFKNTVDSYYALKKHSMKVRLKFFFSNFFGNIFLFVPFSFLVIELLKITDRKVIIGIGALTSLLIEFLQFSWKIGIPDIDDVLLNTAGVIVGLFLWKNYVKRNQVTGNIRPKY